MVSQRVFDLCQSDRTVSSEVAKNPELAPGSIGKRLYGGDTGGHGKSKAYKAPDARPEDLQKASECGIWGDTRPSQLFLKVCFSCRRTGVRYPILTLFRSITTFCVQ